jgi:HAE1 family hydrophobic/amphiphilic exporter-1
MKRILWLMLAALPAPAAERRLALHEAIEMALAANLEIEIERTSTASAAQLVRAARGAFDPTLRWLPQLESRATPAASVLQAATGKLNDHLFAQNFYFRHRLPSHSLSWRVDFENSRQSTSNPFASLNPYTTSRLTVGFTQPLLRGRLADRERTELRVRSKLQDLSATDLELRVIDVVFRVEQAYWALVAARLDVEVRAENVELAREQVGRTRRMIEGGMLAPVELAAAEAELERRIDTHLASQTARTTVENALKELIAGGRGSALWNDEIVPPDERLSEAPVFETVDEAIETAVKQRAELRGIAIRADANDIQSALAREEVKPRVDFVASYANAGLGGAVSAQENPFSSSNAALYERVNRLSAAAGLAPIAAPSFGGLPDILVGGYGTALANVFGGRFQTFQAGLSMDLTFRNRAAEAALEQTAIAGRRLKLERARVEQLVSMQVRNATQAVESARQRIAAAEASVRAAREKLESEIRLFQAGESTNFFVLTRQNEHADSRLRLVTARSDFNRSVAAMRQALGATLAGHRVALR